MLRFICVLALAVCCLAVDDKPTSPKTKRQLLLGTNIFDDGRWVDDRLIVDPWVKTVRPVDQWLMEKKVMDWRDVEMLEKEKMLIKTGVPVVDFVSGIPTFEQRIQW